jgi:hypothetical protein
MTSPHSTWPTLVLQEARLGAINRIAHDFRRTGAKKTSQVFSPTRYWHLPQSTAGTWESSLSHSACAPYCNHFGVSNISPIPPILEVGPLLAQTRIKDLCQLASPSRSGACNIISLVG